MDPSAPTDPGTSRQHQAGSRLALTFNPAEFAGFVAEFDLTEAQRNDLLETLWTIMVGFVDLGFEIHPIQQAMPLDQVKLLGLEADPMLASDASYPFDNFSAAHTFGARVAERQIHDPE